MTGGVPGDGGRATGRGGPAGRGPLPLAPALTAGLLLAVPVVVLLIVPLYARTGPELLGFPFFYWFQLVWVVAAAALTYVAYLVVQHARRGGSR